MLMVRHMVLLFFVYSVIGWLWETVYCSLKAGKFVYRGFLVGPYCPIYGFGVLSVLFFVEPYQNNILLLYVFSAVLVTILEYLTSYVLEKAFHATWWDYHDVPLNINGRVALPISLFWGLGCVFIVKIVQPEVAVFVSLLENKFGNLLPIATVIMMSADLIYTICNMVAFRRALEAWSALMEERKEDIQKRVTVDIEKRKEQVAVERSEWLEYVKEKPKELLELPKLTLNHRRMLTSFNNLKFKKVRSMAELKEAIALYRKEKK